MQLPAGRLLSWHWLDPFVSNKTVGPVSYWLDLLESLHIHPVFYVSKLREYRDPGDSRNTVVPDPIELNKQLEWGVKKILHHKHISQGK